MPWTVRGIALAAPASFRQTASDLVRRWWPDTREDSPARDVPFESGVAALVLLGSLIGFAFALRALSKVAIEARPVWHDLIPAFAPLVLPGTYMYFSPPYDFPTLLLFTLGLLFISRRQTWPYLVVFLLATLNKETSILLTLVWVTSLWRREKPERLAVGLLAQVGVWLAVRTVLILLYQDNPGTAFEWHLPRNLQMLSEARAYFSFRTAAGFIPRGLNVVYLAVLAWILVRFRRIPRMVKLGLLPLPPLLLAALFFGFVEELRDYYEVYPAVVLASPPLSCPARRRTGADRPSDGPTVDA